MLWFTAKARGWSRLTLLCTTWYLKGYWRQITFYIRVKCESVIGEVLHTIISGQLASHGTRYSILTNWCLFSLSSRSLYKCVHIYALGKAKQATRSLLKIQYGPCHCRLTQSRDCTREPEFIPCFEFCLNSCGVWSCYFALLFFGCLASVCLLQMQDYSRSLWGYVTVRT